MSRQVKIERRQDKTIPGTPEGLTRPPNTIREGDAAVKRRLAAVMRRAVKEGRGNFTVSREPTAPGIQQPFCLLRFFTYPTAPDPSTGHETYTAKWVSVFCLFGWTKPYGHPPGGLYAKQETRKHAESGAAGQRVVFGEAPLSL